MKQNDLILGKSPEQIKKEKNSIAYRLSNRLFLEISPSHKIAKNIFYNYISIPPIENDTRELIKNMSSLNDEELEILLSKTLGSYFKEFINQSRLSKASIETYFNELAAQLHKNYQTFKLSEQEIFNKRSKKIQDRINEINNLFLDQKEIIDTIKFQLDRSERIATKERIEKIEDKQTKSKAIKAFYDKRDKIEEQRNKPLEFMKAEAEAVRVDIEKLEKERRSLIDDLNKYSIELANQFDSEYAKKQKQIAALEIEKINAYIFIRNSLILLNRIIRDVKIEIGLRKIKKRWVQILSNFEKIQQQSEKITEEFKFFDATTDIESKIDAIRDIELSASLANFDTLEESEDRKVKVV